MLVIFSIYPDKTNLSFSFVFCISSMLVPVRERKGSGRGSSNTNKENSSFWGELENKLGQGRGANPASDTIFKKKNHGI